MYTKKKIVIVTSTRADYGKLKSIILKIQKNKNFTTKVFVTGMHNLKLYGHTIKEIKKDKIKNLVIFKNQKKNSSMNKILINTIRGFSRFIDENKPDLVILHGDRVEPLGCAISSVLNNIRIIHIEGGEVSGTVDEMLRHAISKLSHIHFTSNKIAKKRLIQMGENKKSIFVTGSPDIDLIKSENLPELSKVKKRYGIKFERFAIAIFHPVTTEINKLENHSRIFFEALKKTKKNFVITYPNNDLGANIIFKEIFKLKRNKKFKIFPSIRFEYFLTLLKNSDFIIGNSSCGIIEAPYYNVPTINIGNRQKNRIKKNKLIKNVDFNQKIILNTIKEIKKSKMIKKSFFGNGKSARIINYLINSKELWKINLQKNFIDLVR